MNEDVQIEEATVKDAHVLAEIQRQTWLCNYPNSQMGITKEAIEDKINQWNKIGDERITRILQNPNTHTWVAKVNG
jgi:hypothetical protein